MKKKKNESKYLIPLIFLVISLFIILLVFIVIKSTQKDEVIEKDEKRTSLEIPINDNEEIIEEETMVSNLLSIPENINAPSVDSDLESIKTELQNPYVLMKFINENFNIDSSDLSLIAREPEVFYETKEGSLVDAILFSARALKTMTSLVGIIRYDYLNASGEQESRLITYFRYNNNPKYITVNQESKLEMYSNSQAFENIIRNEESRLSINSFRFGLLPINILDFSELIEPATWQYLD